MIGRQWDTEEERARMVTVALTTKSATFFAWEKDMVLEEVEALRGKLAAAEVRIVNAERVLERFGPCKACQGSGEGEGELVPFGDTYVRAPGPCELCGGLGSKAAERAIAWRDGWVRSVLGVKPGEDLITHAMGLRARMNRAEAALHPVKVGIDQDRRELVAALGSIQELADPHAPSRARGPLKCDPALDEE